MLRFKTITIALAVLMLLVTIPAFSRLGSEFMPPLNEGMIFYMPTTVPGISVTQASRLLQIQDRILKSFPEVERVFGKSGRAETPTDPAPFSMMETTVMLKPESEWRKGMTWDKLVEEMDRALRLPGVANAWTIPIKNRIDMLSTGIRIPLAAKIFGPDLKKIEEIGKQLEGILQPIAGTRTVFAQRVTGGYYLDINVRRDAVARYGLMVGDVGMLIESAIGGESISSTIEGTERYPINLRYARELRDDPEKLKRVLVPVMDGAQVPLGQPAYIQLTAGPSMIKNEEGQLVGYVTVDMAERDIGGYVEEAKRVVAQKIALPLGYRLLEWARRVHAAGEGTADLCYSAYDLDHLRPSLPELSIGG